MPRTNEDRTNIFLSLNKSGYIEDDADTGKYFIIVPVDAVGSIPTDCPLAKLSLRSISGFSATAVENAMAKSDPISQVLAKFKKLKAEAVAAGLSVSDVQVRKAEVDK